MSSLGSRIRDLRKSQKLTQQVIADRLGMGRSNFGHIENDRVVPSSEDLESIADILDTTTDYLLGRSQNNLILAEGAASYSVSKNDIRDLKKMLEEGNVTFDGVPINETQRQRVMDILTGYLWDVKDTKNKEQK